MEMEDKINPAQKQAEYLHDDVTHKMKIFNRLHKHVLDSQQACGCVKIDINKCFIVLAQKKVSSMPLSYADAILQHAECLYHNLEMGCSWICVSSLLVNSSWKGSC